MFLKATLKCCFLVLACLVTLNVPYQGLKDGYEVLDDRCLYYLSLLVKLIVCQSMHLQSNFKTMRTNLVSLTYVLFHFSYDF